MVLALDELFHYVSVHFTHGVQVLLYVEEVLLLRLDSYTGSSCSGESLNTGRKCEAKCLLVCLLLSRAAHCDTDSAVPGERDNKYATDHKLLFSSPELIRMLFQQHNH